MTLGGTGRFARLTARGRYAEFARNIRGRRPNPGRTRAAGASREDNTMRARLASLIVAATAAVLATGAPAQETTLRAVSAFVETGTYVKRFQPFMDKVQADSKGGLQHQLHRRPEGDAALRGRQRRQDRRRRHGARDRRLLHQRHSRKPTPGSSPAPDGGAAPERRLRPHAEALQREDGRASTWPA